VKSQAQSFSTAHLNSLEDVTALKNASNHVLLVIFILIYLYKYPLL
jgi:hypothetical protein